MERQWKVIRWCDGSACVKFEGTLEECEKWLARRGDTNRAYYTFE